MPLVENLEREFLPGLNIEYLRSYLVNAWDAIVKLDITEGTLPALDQILEFESFTPVYPEEVGLSWVGAGVHTARIYKLRINILRRDLLTTDFLLVLKLAFASNDGLAETLINSDSDMVEVGIFFKSMEISGKQDERRAYERLRILNIPTVCCIYPPNTGFISDIAQDLQVKDLDTVATVVLPNALPLSAYNVNRVFEKRENLPSLFRSLLNSLTEMHKNYLIHGDPQLKNWLAAQNTIYALDFEAFIDFSVAVGPSKDEAYIPMFKYAKRLVLNRYKSFKQNAELGEVFQEAIWLDMAKLADGIDFINLSAESFAEMKACIESYLQELTHAGVIERITIEKILKLFELS